MVLRMFQWGHATKGGKGGDQVVTKAWGREVQNSAGRGGAGETEKEKGWKSRKTPWNPD